MDNVYDIGQKVYFSNLKYDHAANSLDSSIISNYLVHKVIMEKVNDKYLFTYILCDDTGAFLTKKEDEIFSTLEQCQAYINTAITTAITTLQNAVN